MCTNDEDDDGDKSYAKSATRVCTIRKGYPPKPARKTPSNEPILNDYLIEH